MTQEKSSIGIPVGDFAQAWGDGKPFTIQQRKLFS
jgi:hypothetical protein